MTIHLTKMHGCGNDFVLIAKDESTEVPIEVLIRHACNRRRGIGADGAIIFSRDIADNITMSYYNCDGHEAQMCFNGARCAAWQAQRLGYASSPLKLLTGYGELTAVVEGNNVELEFSPPNDCVVQMALPSDCAVPLGLFAPIADPHLILRVDENLFESFDFLATATQLRWNTALFPDGTNVHAVSRAGSVWRIRSFERGIEDETEACGSGCVAALLALGVQSTSFLTAGGDELWVSNNVTSWRLRGPVTLVAHIALAMDLPDL